MAPLVVIIEDNPLNTKLVREILQAYGYKTREAAIAEQGLEMVRREKPDLILLDIELPGMDGLQVARLLKGDPATRDIPVLAVTAYAMKGDAEKALAAGCDDYISKPIHVHDFLSRIKKFVEKNDRDDKPSL